MSEADSITVLSCAPQLRLAKQINADGSTVDYDSPRLFSGAEYPVAGLDGLLQGLTSLQGQPQRCVVRGALVGAAPVSKMRRLLHRDPETGDEPTLRETPRRWLALDMDGCDRPEGVPAADLLGCAAAVMPELPADFHGASCVVQASAGHGRKPGSRLRLWFWLARGVERSELEVWFAGRQVDPVSFRPAQVIYTAAPVFSGSQVDHLPTRLAVLPGRAEVAVPPKGALQLPERPRMPPRHIPAEKAHDFAQNAFQRGLVAVASAPVDSRHNVCVRIAFHLACLCHEGRLSQSDVRDGLGVALAHAGKSETEAYRVFDWAMGQASGVAA